MARFRLRSAVALVVAVSALAGPAAPAPAGAEAPTRTDRGGTWVELERINDGGERTFRTYEPGDGHTEMWATEPYEGHLQLAVAYDHFPAHLLTLDPPQGQSLMVGPYHSPIQSRSKSPIHFGMEVLNGGEGCYGPGHADVLEFEQAADGTITRLAVDYVVRCPSRMDYLRGRFRFHASGHYPGPLDTDADGVPDTMDHCRSVPDPQQLDSDRDLVGDACDPRADRSSVVTTRSARYGPYGAVGVAYPDQGFFQVTGNATEVVVRYGGGYGSAGGTITLGNRAGLPLLLGLYEDAVPNNPPDPLRPRLDLDGTPEAGCSGATTQRFEIFEIAFDTTGTIDQLTADVEQRCASDPEYFVRTRVRFHSSILFAPSPGLLDQDLDLVDSSTDNCPHLLNPLQLDTDGDGEGDACDDQPQVTYLELTSDGPADPIGRGEHRLLQPKDGDFFYSPNGPLFTLTFTDFQTQLWDLMINAPLRKAGSTHTSAGGPRLPSSSGQLSLRRSTEACPKGVESRFVIHEMVVSSSHSDDTHISIDFDHRCVGSSTWLHGRFRFNASPELTDPVPTVRRHAGADRVATAVAAAEDLDPTPETSQDVEDRKYGAWAVVLARKDSFADALAGTPLAAALNAPLLLTDKDTLDERTLAEIRRAIQLGGRVFLLGGPASISPAIEQQLEDAPYDVIRYGGADRYATAAAIADAVSAFSGDRIDNVLLATGTNFPDGLAAGAAATASHGVVLLTNGTTMPPATAAYLAAHPDLPVTAIGGQAAAAAPRAAKVVGANRYATALAVAARFFPGDVASAGLAGGESFPDALSGGTHAARLRGPLLLTDGDTLLPAVAELLGHHVFERVDLYGGPQVISPEIEAAIAESLTEEPRPQRIGPLTPPPVLLPLDTSGRYSA